MSKMQKHTESPREYAQRWQEEAKKRAAARFNKDHRQFDTKQPDTDTKQSSAAANSGKDECSDRAASPDAGAKRTRK